MPPADDPTIPQDQAAKLECAKRIARAFASIKNAVDAHNNNAFGTRWTPSALGNPPYDKALIVLRCLELVELLIDLHKKGPSVLRCFDKQYSAFFASTKKWAFADRVDAIVELFETRKSRCDMFIKGENIDAVAGNPRKLMNGSKANGAANAKKAIHIQYGKPEWEKVKADAASQSDDNATPGAASTPGAITDDAQIPATVDPDLADQSTTASQEDQQQPSAGSELSQPKEQKKRGRPKKATTTQQAAPTTAAAREITLPDAPPSFTGPWVRRTVASGSASGPLRASTQPADTLTTSITSHQATTSPYSLQSLDSGRKHLRPAEADFLTLSAPPKRRRGDATAPALGTNASTPPAPTDGGSTLPAQVQNRQISTSLSLTRKRRAEDDAVETLASKRTRSGKR
ncbi:hypothetical protein E8E11_002283 [Didymella keratinophila]|nr:hypothetical protein E8E11_002283 [Didymella keratinophila]